MLTRREFISQGGAAVSLLATGATLPAFLTRTARAASPGRDQTILVVVQLSGGNDGLNMAAPYRDDLYHRARPTLRVTEERALPLNDHLALHPEMTGLKRLFDDGRLTLINNVGYPNPDRSHFRSMDIWHTADLAPEGAADGWLGRLVDRGRAAPPVAGQADADPGHAPLALHLDDDSLPLALKTQIQPVPSFRALDAARLPAELGAVVRTIAAPREAASPELLFVQRTAVASCANAQRIQRIAEQPTATEYPGYGLARRLRDIAQLIAADFGPRIYYTSLGGFDTHARQALAHGPLLRELSESVAAFYADLEAHGLAERVLLLSFSEFGRRVKENSGQGTDHGAAAPMFLAGPACAGGVLGGPTDLGRLVDGDVQHALDFRQVYATVLDRWLAAPSKAILGQSYAHVPALRGLG